MVFCVWGSGILYSVLLSRYIEREKKLKEEEEEEEEKEKEGGEGYKSMAH